MRKIIEENIQKLSNVTDSTIFFEDIKGNIIKEKVFNIKGNKIIVKAIKP